ncbi:MAG TPA: M20/M25/M40 family metallo-hydrolase [Chitinophagales bacterium]|nr:M20/M25/M40 family metallo-hydrolase [Chitinophagales bacterium]
MKTLIKIASISLLLLFFSINNLKAQNPNIQAIINLINIDSLVKTVQEISGEVTVTINGATHTITSRSFSHPGNELAFQYLKSRFLDLEYDIDSLKYSSTGKNLWAIKLGTKNPKRIVVLGAHYDNLPFSGIAPGADDNGSGVAAVLEAARVLKDINLPYTVILALWDEEEIGLVGSQAYAASAESNNDTLIGYINLDMIAWDSDNDGSVEIHVRPIAQSLDLLEDVIFCNNEYQIGLDLKINNPGSSDSDYASFWNNNLSAIGINEEYYGDFNPYWHTSDDRLEFFNLDYFLKCSQLAIATLVKIASKESTPVSITENIKSSTNIIIYPNPFSGELNLNFEDHISSKKISLLDLSGKIVFETHSSQSQLNISTSEIPSGIYILSIYYENQSYSKKLLKL